MTSSQDKNTQSGDMGLETRDWRLGTGDCVVKRTLRIETRENQALETEGHSPEYLFEAIIT